MADDTSKYEIFISELQRDVIRAALLHYMATEKMADAVRQEASDLHGMLSDGLDAAVYEAGHPENTMNDFTA